VRWPAGLINRGHLGQEVRKLVPEKFSGPQVNCPVLAVEEPHAFAFSSEGETGTSASLRARCKASIMRALNSLLFLDESGVV
jgi:hypothetical protein